MSKDTQNNVAILSKIRQFAIEVTDTISDTDVAFKGNDFISITLSVNDCFFNCNGDIDVNKIGSELVFRVKRDDQFIYDLNSNDLQAYFEDIGAI